MNATNGGSPWLIQKKTDREPGVKFVDTTGSTERTIRLCKNIAERCSYTKIVNGIRREIPSKTGDFIDVVNGWNYRELLRYIAPALWQALNEVLPKMYRELPFVREVLGLTPDLLTLMESGRRKSGTQELWPPVHYFGFDAIGFPGEEWKIHDLNTNLTIFVGFLDQIINCFRLESQSIGSVGSVIPFEIEDEGDHFQPVEESFFKLLVDLAGTDDPNIAVLTVPGDPYQKAVENITASGNEFLSTSGRKGQLVKVFAGDLAFSGGELTAFGKSVSVIYRLVQADLILNNPERYAPVISATEAGIPMVNPLESKVVGSKASFYLLTWGSETQQFLTDNLQQLTRKLLQQFFAPSALVYQGEAHTPEEKVDIERYLNEQIEFQGHRTKRWRCSVFKRGYSFGGKDIHHGSRLSRWRFTKLLSELRSGTWTIEPELKHRQVDALVGQLDGSGNWSASLKRLNLINRFYLINHFTEFIWGETFGAVTRKVNAAGWSFPMAFHKQDQP